MIAPATPDPVATRHPPLIPLKKPDAAVVVGNKGMTGASRLLRSVPSRISDRAN
jgi:hypothetical protein